MDIKQIEEIINLSREIKALEAKKKTLTDILKTEMIASNQNTIRHNGSTITLTTSTKVSVKKGMKEKLLLFLKQKNLNSCISLTPDINKESLETEINIGNVTQAELNQYMNYTEVNSIRVTV